MSSPTPATTRHAPTHPAPIPRAPGPHGLEGRWGAEQAQPSRQHSGTAWATGPKEAAAAAPDRPDQAPPSPLLQTPEAREALRVLQAAGLEAPPAATVQALAAQAEGVAEHQELVSQCRDALTGRGTLPGPEVWGRATTAVLGQQIAGTFSSRSNVTAYVFLVMLQAQIEAIEEKRESLRALKMHTGMLEDLNAWVARVVVPAQRALNAKIRAGHSKDSLNKRDKSKSVNRDERIEEAISVPDTVDTAWGAVDTESGKVYIPNLLATAVSPKKLDAQDISTLIAQTDQWRATMQNNQNKQSMDFKRIDDAMSATWNMLSAFLKSANEGTSAIIRNGQG